MSLDPGPVALVTGASRGIGRAIALELAAAGYSIAVNYRANAEAAREVCRLVERAGQKAAPLQADIASAADRERLLGGVREAFGRLDLLVNNAARAPGARRDLLEATESSFDEILAANLKGPYFLTQAVARWMISQGSARPGLRFSIVNISSVSEYTPSVNRGDYCLAKAGIGMLTRLYASRLAEHGIRVNEVRPGIIATDMTAPVKQKYDELIGQGLTPIRRWGTPEDVARAVRLLAGPDLEFSTALAIDVDGGFHLHRL